MTRVGQVFWSIAAIDAVVFTVMLVATLRQPGPADGGREMAIFFFVVVPFAVLVAAMLLFRYCDSGIARAVALLVVAVPGLFFAGSRLRDMGIDRSIGAYQSGAGYFGGSAMRAIAVAVVRGDVQDVRRLAPSVDVNAVGERGMTLIRLAVEGGVGEKADSRGDDEAAVVRALLAAGAKPDPGLDSASKRADTTMLRLLLEAGGNANYRADGGQPLVFSWLAVLTPDALRLLAAHGLDLNSTSYDDPLAVVVTIHRRWDLLAVLIQLGADTTRPRPDGRNVAGELAEQTAELLKEGRDVPAELTRATRLLDARRSVRG